MFHSIQLQKIAPRMHQNSPFQLKNQKISWGKPVPQWGPSPPAAPQPRGANRHSAPLFLPPLQKIMAVPMPCPCSISITRLSFSYRIEQCSNSSKFLAREKTRMRTYDTRKTFLGNYLD